MDTTTNPGENMNFSIKTVGSKTYIALKAGALYAYETRALDAEIRAAMQGVNAKGAKVIDANGNHVGAYRRAA